MTIEKQLQHYPPSQRCLRQVLGGWYCVFTRNRLQGQRGVYGNNHLCISLACKSHVVGGSEPTVAAAKTSCR